MVISVPNRRRSVRDWLVDGLLFAIALAVVVSAPPESNTWLAGAGCLALWLRRRWPVGVALGCAPLGLFILLSPAAPPVLALFGVAVHRPARTALLVAVPVLAAAPLYFVVHPDSVYLPYQTNLLASIITVVGALGWGMLVRSRRQVLVSLRERAERAEAGQQLRVAQARQVERHRLAQETHDVLAHRISVVSLHAGVLEHRAVATAAEISQAAGVIRVNAHQALQELREVIGLLRDRPDRAAPPPADEHRAEVVKRVPQTDAARLPGPDVREQPSALPWLVDTGLFMVSAALVALYGLAADGIWTSEPLRRADLVFGALASLLLWLRRRYPVAVAVACVPLGVFVFSTGLAAALIALFTVAARRPPRTALLISAVAAVLAPVHLRVWNEQTAGGERWINISIGLALLAAALGWGMLARSRHQLVGTLQDRAGRARQEQLLRMAQARREERTRLAREMHDVLAHRISLVSLHAGVLESGTDTTAAEISQAAGVIRANAQAAARELREVIGLLHEAPAVPGRPERPQPCLADVAELVDQSTAAGNPVHYTTTVADPGAVPAAIGRAVYHLTQEALTNARKHAPGTDVRVRLTAVPGWLHLEVTNPLPTGERDEMAGQRDEMASRHRELGGGTAPGSGTGPISAAERAAPATKRPATKPPATRRPAQDIAMPGSGTGLIGMAERVALADGRLTHGPTPGGTFVLEAWIPCPA